MKKDLKEETLNLLAELKMTILTYELDYEIEEAEELSEKIDKVYDRIIEEE